MIFKFIDEKVKGNLLRYFIQCLITSLLFFIIMLFIDFALETTIVASLAATTFIIFTLPHKPISRFRNIIGGYTVCSIIGSLSWYIYIHYTNINLQLLIAIAVGICIFVMTITNTEHPPAAAFAFGIIVDGFNFTSIITVFIAALFFVIIKHYTKRWLIDLL